MPGFQNDVRMTKRERDLLSHLNLFFFSLFFSFLVNLFFLKKIVKYQSDDSKIMINHLCGVNDHQSAPLSFPD